MPIKEHAPIRQTICLCTQCRKSTEHGVLGDGRLLFCLRCGRGARPWWSRSNHWLAAPVPVEAGLQRKSWQPMTGGRPVVPENKN
jgi:hypothetical protein